MLRFRKLIPKFNPILVVIVRYFTWVSNPFLPFRFPSCSCTFVLVVLTKLWRQEFLKTLSACRFCGYMGFLRGDSLTLFFPPTFRSHVSCKPVWARPACRVIVLGVDDVRKSVGGRRGYHVLWYRNFLCRQDCDIDIEPPIVEYLHDSRGGYEAFLFDPFGMCFPEQKTWSIASDVFHDLFK